MARRKAVQEQETALEPITPIQQTFIELLLSGKTISAAALLAGISRRTATYWLADPAHPVTLEYEKQRFVQEQNFYTRVAALHDSALKAMEWSLSPEAPPGIRWAAAKFLYEKHLERLCCVQPAEEALDLVKEEAGNVKARDYFKAYEAYNIHAIPE